MRTLTIARKLVHGVSDQEVHELLVGEDLDRSRRRELRMPRGASMTKPPACPACHVFVLNISAPCTACGYQRDRGWTG